MDLLDRYVRTVRWMLPRRQREDIIRELIEEIREQMTHKERDRGRPLTAEEQAEVIAQYGHPVVFAARYRPQRYLIGPIVYPYYVMAIQIGLAIVIVSSAIAIGQASWNQVPMEAWGVGKEILGKALRVLGWLTVVAVIVERTLVNAGAFDKWTPNVPGPPLEHAMRAVQQAVQVVHDTVDRRS